MTTRQTSTSGAPFDWGSASMNSWGNSIVPPVSGQLAMPKLDMLNQIQGYAPVTDLSTMASPGTLAAIGQGGQPSFMQNMLGYRAPDGTQFGGWGGMALGAASGLMNGFIGMKQLGLAKDSLAQGKKQFELNFGAQQKLTNSRLEDRQRARVSANPAAYQSVSEYMNKNGI
jgi:hypothetical protein